MYRIWKAASRLKLHRLANALAFSDASSHVEDILPVLLPKGVTEHRIQSFINGWYSKEAAGWIHGW